MTRIARAIPLLLFGCAGQASDASSSRPEVPAFEERLAENLAWQPGDAEPVERNVARWAAVDEKAPVQPVTWCVEIRNRCRVPATFVVGPADEAPPTDAPKNVLAAGEAIWAWIPGGDALHLRDPRGGGSAKATLQAKHVVFVGDEACDRIAQL